MIRKLLFAGAFLLTSLRPNTGNAQNVPELMYYNFDVSGTTVPNNASSPVGLNPAPVNGTTLSIGGTGEFSTTGLVGTGGSPSQNYVNTDWNVNFASSSWTISAYIDLPSSPTNSYFFGDGTQSAGPLTCFFVTGATGNLIRFRGTTVNSTAYSLDLPNPTFPIVLHYVYDYGAGTLSLYTNGTFHSSTNIGQQSFATTNTANKFFVGASNTNYISLLPINPPMTLNGTLDEFRMYNRALTAGEITATWNQPLPLGPCTAPPTAGTASAVKTAICAGSNAYLNLSGNSFGTGQTYTWQASATNVAGSYADIAAASPLSSATVTPASNTYYRCVVTCGTQSDTSAPVQVTLNYPVSGTYTINANLPTGGTNFHSFADAVARFECGVNGPVTWDVVPGSGPYNEQVIISTLPGLSETTPLIINGNGETLSYVSTNSNLRSVLRLSGMNYITIDSLNIVSAPLSSEYAYGIQIMNNSNNITVKNCTVDVGFAATNNNTSGIVINGSNTSPSVTNSEADSITITNNKIIGGYMGITLIGNGTAKTKGNKIINNEIVDFYNYGIYANGTDGLLIENNDVHRQTAANVSSFYGIAISGGATTNTLITRNRVHNTAGGKTNPTDAANGIYFSGADATLGSENIVTNNLIYDFNNASGAAYGLYNSGSDGTHFFHNTVLLNHSAASTGATYGFYQSTTATNIVLNNNIIAVTRGGSGVKYCYFFNTSGTTATSDYNDLYLAPAGTGTANLVRYAGVDYAQLSNWQSTSADAMSFSIDPLFNNPSTGDLEPLEPSINNQGLPIATVTVDFYNNARSSAAPDLGAIENSQFPLDMQFISFTAVADADNAILNWTVAKDQEIADYEIERALDGRTFKKIGTVKSGKLNAVAKYTYTDEKIAVSSTAKTIYYRIKANTENGKNHYSHAALLSLKPADQTVTVYPNPFMEQLILNVNSNKEQVCQITIADVKGATVLAEQKAVAKGSNTIQLNGVQQLAKGVYHLNVVLEGITYSSTISK